MTSAPEGKLQGGDCLIVIGTEGFALWPWMLGRKSLGVPADDIVEEAVQMFLTRYGRRP